MTQVLVQQYDCPIHLACQLMGLAHSSYYYRNKVRDENQLMQAIEKVTGEFPKYGTRECGGIIAIFCLGRGCTILYNAPWAQAGHGFKAVISTSFTVIFCNNTLKNGPLPIIVDQKTRALRIDLFEELPRIELTIDLPTQTLSLPNHETGSFPIDNFSKTCVLKGTDELSYLLSFENQIDQYELAQAQ